MNNKLIYGIQQVGVGVENVHQAWAWYRKHFGMDIKAFEEAATAELMLHYTEGKPRPRHAVLAMNMQAGGGFEIWQHTGKTPQKPNFEIKLGDLGIFSAKLKTKDIEKAYSGMKENGVTVLGEISKSPCGTSHFFVRDPYENIFQIVENDYQFCKTPALTGGIFGAIIGVSNMEKSLALYKDVLGYDKIVYDKTENFDDLSSLPGGNAKARRILLEASEKATGGFAPLLGPTQLELVELKESEAKKIYEGRIWGDPGFIHLCFDIHNMDKLREECANSGFPFTVDSKDSFDMGDAAGHFSYVSDPDGTPIEFVETHKLPLIKSIGWGINLQNRDPKKPIPRWILKALKMKRVK